MKQIQKILKEIQICFVHHLIPNNNAMHTQGFLAFEDPDLSDEPGSIAQSPQAEARNGIAHAGGCGAIAGGTWRGIASIRRPRVRAVLSRTRFLRGTG